LLPRPRDAQAETTQWRRRPARAERASVCLVTTLLRRGE
jgi:hypothetical protein